MTCMLDVNTFRAKLNYFHNQHFKIFLKGKYRINQKYLFTLGNGLNTSEKSKVKAQTPPLKSRRLSLDCIFFCHIYATQALKTLT